MQKNSPSDLLRKAGSVCCVLCLMCAFLNNFAVISFGKRYGSIICIVATVFFCLLGYTFSAVFGKVQKFQRPREDFDLHNQKYFSPSVALLPLLCVVICAIVLTVLYRSYRLGVDRYLDKYSLELYFLPLVASLVILCGVILWFYPYHKIVSRNSIIGYFIGFLISFIISIIFEVDCVFLTVCFAVFLLFYFILCNQRCYERFFSSRRYLAPESRFGRYNLKLAIRHYLLTIGCFAVVLSLCIIVASSFNFSGRSSSDDYEKEQKQEYVYTEKDNTAPKTFEGEKSFIADEAHGDDSTVGLICGTVVIIGVIALLLYLLFRKKPHLALFSFIHNLFDAMLEFITSLFYLLFAKKYSGEAKRDFVDKYEKFDVEYTESRIRRHESLTPKSFEEHYNSIDELPGRFAYVYGVYCKLLTEQGLGIKRSDTPREIIHKLNLQNDNSLNVPSGYYEIIRYANKKAPEEELAKYLPIMKEICLRTMRNV